MSICGWALSMVHPPLECRYAGEITQYTSCLIWRKLHTYLSNLIGKSWHFSSRPTIPECAICRIACPSTCACLCRYFDLRYSFRERQSATVQAWKPRSCPDFAEYIAQSRSRSLSPYGPILDYDPGRYLKPLIHKFITNFHPFKTPQDCAKWKDRVPKWLTVVFQSDTPLS